MKRIVLFMLMLMTVPAYAQYPTLSRSICQTHSIIISNAAEYRRQGMPIDVAFSTINSARDDRYLYMVLHWGVEMAYSEPDKMKEMVASGKWVDICELALLNPREFTRLTGYGYH